MFADEMRGGRQVVRSRSGALLNMLAEVASQELQSDRTAGPPVVNPVTRLSRSKRLFMRGKSASNTCVTFSELQNLSSNHLLKLYADFDGDEMKRTFSYTCRIDTVNCRQQFSSFGSENKAREQMKIHLQSHVSQLAVEGISTERYETTDCQKRKMSSDWKEMSVSKKAQRNRRDSGSQPREPDENDSNMPNKKQCGGWNEREREREKERERERSVDESMYNIYQEHNYTSLSVTAVAAQERTGPETNAWDAEYTVLQVYDDNLAVAQYEEIPVHGGTDPMQPQAEFTRPDDIVLVCCVDNDWVNQLSVYGDDGTGAVTKHLEHNLSDETVIKKKGEIATVKREAVIVNCMEPQEDNMERKKPKGKAKFIGQSKVEKEMAIAMIESMKRKGNSTECLECRICNPPRVFTAPTTLISHYRSHAGIKPYECRICGSVFTRQHSLNYHMLIHSNKTRFTCTDCGRTFRHPSHFKEHRRRHTGESPYQCADCSVRFKTRNTFKRHMKTRHGKRLTTAGTVVAMTDDECAQAGTLLQQEHVLPPNKQQKLKKELVKQVQKRFNTMHSTSLPFIENLVPVKMKGEDSVQTGDIVEQALRQSDICFPSSEGNGGKVKVETVWNEPPLCDSSAVPLHDAVVGCGEQVRPLVHTLTATVSSSVERNAPAAGKPKVAAVSVDTCNVVSPPAEICQHA